MKYIYASLLSLSLFGCWAQTPVIPIYGNNNFCTVENAYYKDINNFRDQFVGTWLYVNGTTSLKIIFVKKNMSYTTEAPKNCYADYLIGGSQYIENGVEKYNTMSSINLNHSNIYDYFMFSSLMIKSTNYPKCNDCSINEKRLVISYEEPLTKSDLCLDADLVIRHILENGTEKLMVRFLKVSGACGSTIDETSPLPNLNFTLPFGNYTLIKQ